MLTRTGNMDLKHLSEGIRKHEKSDNHLNSSVKFVFFGITNIMCKLDTGHKASIEHHSKDVDKNTNILSKIIDCLKFCESQELGVLGHDERMSVSVKVFFWIYWIFYLTLIKSI